MLLIATFERHSHVWLVDHERVAWQRIDGWGVEQTATTVKALRCGLDAAAWANGGCGKAEFDEKKGPPFDFARAAQLYDAFFRPFEGVIANRSVFVVASGPLTTIPLHVMLSEPLDPGLQGDDRYRQAKWVALRKLGFTLLPSVSALAVLREPSRQRQGARQPFIGFGNPLLDGRPGDKWHVNDKQLALQFQSCPAANAWCKDRGLHPPALQSAAPPPAGTTSFLAALRSLAPLPDTACELCAIATAVGMSAQSVPETVWLGARATERNVKALSRSGVLAKYDIVQFATHGLLAGQSAKLGHSSGEPGLVLTPPVTGIAAQELAEDDGLLTSSEIAQLQLDADWVILSACNTASGQIDEAEALSGIARAFFAAGARALLVSGWEVDSIATTKLSTTAIQYMRDTPTAGRTEALQGAMQQIMRDTSRPSNWVPAFHPAIWAPFFVTGDGGR